MGGFEKGGQNFKIAMLLIGNPHKAQRKTCCRLGLSVDLCRQAQTLYSWLFAGNNFKASLYIFWSFTKFSSSVKC